MITKLPERISGLYDLAYNLWWSWNPAARMLFKMIDRIAWKESGHNPVRMLRELPEGALLRVLDDREYLSHYDLVIDRFREYLETRICWFTEHVKSLPCLPIAYFSAEYGLHHSLPFYAGGLGFLAGDYLKESSDLGVPLVAFGFMYPEGYLKQKIGMNGWQEDVHEPLERDAAPIERVMTREGEHMVVQVPFMEPAIHVAVWNTNGAEAGAPFGSQTIPGGTYMVVQHWGDYELIGETYMSTIKWAEESGIDFADQPSFVHHVNDPDSAPVEQWLTEIYLPFEHSATATADAGSPSRVG